MRLLLSLLLIGTLAACRKQTHQVGYWDGEGYETVHIRVIDQKTAKPISGARVWLLTSEAAAAYDGYLRSPEDFKKANGVIERFGSRVFTNRNGEVSIYSPFRAYGDIMADGPDSSYRSVSGYLIVENWDYARVETKLESLLPKNFGQKYTISVVVRLEKKAKELPEPAASGVSHR